MKNNGKGKEKGKKMKVDWRREGKKKENRLRKE